MRLRNHPCIALWCGNNEIDQYWKNSGWSRKYSYSIQDSAEINRNYLTLFNDVLRNSVNMADSKASYIPSSPKAGWGKPENLKIGDVHYWGVWNRKEPFTRFTDNIGRFISEFGFQAFPEMTSVGKFSLPEDIKLGSPVMKAHQKDTVGYDRIDEYLLRIIKNRRILLRMYMSVSFYRQRVSNLPLKRTGEPCHIAWEPFTGS